MTDLGLISIGASKSRPPHNKVRRPAMKRKLLLAYIIHQNINLTVVPLALRTMLRPLHICLSFIPEGE